MGTEKADGGHEIWRKSTQGPVTGASRVWWGRSWRWESISLPGGWSPRETGRSEDTSVTPSDTGTLHPLLHKLPTSQRQPISVAGCVSPGILTQKNVDLRLPSAFKKQILKELLESEGGVECWFSLWQNNALAAHFKFSYFPHIAENFSWNLRLCFMSP